jgi:hypothetical protein
VTPVELADEDLILGCECRVMSAMYSVWDILEDLVFRKVNESDAAKFAELCRCELYLLTGMSQPCS